MESMMTSMKVKHLTEEILALADHERQELAEGVLPELLLTRAGLEAIDQSLHSLSGNEAAAAVMDDAIQAARRARRFDMQILLRGSTPKYLPILG
jgi:hypothetical protein